MREERSGREREGEVTTKVKGEGMREGREGSEQEKRERSEQERVSSLSFYYKTPTIFHTIGK